MPNSRVGDGAQLASREGRRNFERGPKTEMRSQAGDKKQWRFDNGAKGFIMT